MTAEDTVEYWQEETYPTPPLNEFRDPPWHFRIRFANGRISGHDYNSRAAAVEGFHDQNAAIFSILSQVVRSVNEQNGWFEEERRFAEDVALLHSEASEALEEFRDGRVGRYYESVDGDETVYVPLTHASPYPQGLKPIGVPSEMADILIRLLDTCDRYGIDLYREFHAKVQFNATRGHRHGNKAL